MQDQVTNLRARGVPAEYLSSVLTDSERSRVLSGLKKGTGLGVLLVRVWVGEGLLGWSVTSSLPCNGFLYPTTG